MNYIPLCGVSFPPIDGELVCVCSYNNTELLLFPHTSATHILLTTLSYWHRQLFSQVYVIYDLHLGLAFKFNRKTWKQHFF